MNDVMAVLLNGIAQLEYDRRKTLPDHQALYLDKMDEKMDQGINVGDRIIDSPDLQQRAQFIAANLEHAIKDNQEAMAASLCSYLAMRLPDLKQVKIDEQPDGVSIELVFDEAYQKQVPVQFIH